MDGLSSGLVDERDERVRRKGFMAPKGDGVQGADRISLEMQDAGFTLYRCLCLS